MMSQTTQRITTPISGDDGDDTLQPGHAGQSRTLSPAGGLAGMRQAIPLAISTLAVGMVFGVAAREAGLSLTESLLMSGLVSAGTAQFIALGLWATPLPVLPLVFTTLVVNLRHVLMGAALRPWLRTLPAPLLYIAAFFMDDESWALSMREAAAGGRDRAFLLGSGGTMFVCWVVATALGYLLGAVLPVEVRLELDFVFTAAFVALVVGMWRGKADLLAWAAAAGVALVAARWLHGTWYILLGGIAGSLVGMVRHGH